MACVAVSLSPPLLLRCVCAVRPAVSDSIIHFNENLPVAELKAAIDHSLAADVVLCAGTSLRVAPANALPQNCSQAGGRLFICNLQVTGKDRECLQLGGCLIASKTDELARALSAELAIAVADTSAAELAADESKLSALLEAALKANPHAATARANANVAANYHATADELAAIANYPKPAPAGTDGKVAVPVQFYVGHIFEKGSASTNPHADAGVAGAAARVTLFVSSDAEDIVSCAHFIDSVDVEFGAESKLPPVTLKSADRKGLTFVHDLRTREKIPAALRIHFRGGRMDLTIAHVIDHKHAVAARAVPVPPVMTAPEPAPAPAAAAAAAPAPSK
jgi:hypothetical protein